MAKLLPALSPNAKPDSRTNGPSAGTSKRTVKASVGTGGEALAAAKQRVKPAAAGDSFAIYKLQPKGSLKKV